jgi:hypothetical protein
MQGYSHFRFVFILISPLAFQASGAFGLIVLLSRGQRVSIPFFPGVYSAPILPAGLKYRGNNLLAIAICMVNLHVKLTDIEKCPNIAN